MADEEKKDTTETQAGGAPKKDTESGAVKTFTQAEVDQIIKERLERERKKATELAEEARKKAEAEAAAKNGGQ